MDKNLKVSEQLIKVSDERILEIYRALKPYQSTKEELLNLAYELESLYGAVENANFIRSLIQTYEEKGFFKKDSE
ncbi:MAG: diol dehydratase small subunit [Cetobacterium sp.]|uniref:diol dehydratase small subunit n=1 Tax=Cetobacterium sp. TaxID=2071632 RepID=UPI003F2BA1E0